MQLAGASVRDMRLRPTKSVYFELTAALLLAPLFSCPSQAQGVTKAFRSANVVPGVSSPALRALPPEALKDPDPPRLGSTHLSPRRLGTWIALGLAQHGAALFDARTTRNAMNHYKELNPILRPFAHSAALYPIMQIAPAGLDLLGIRMATSRHRWLRRIWWIPQAAATAGFIWAGAHNLQLPTPSGH